MCVRTLACPCLGIRELHHLASFYCTQTRTPDPSLLLSLCADLRTPSSSSPRSLPPPLPSSLATGCPLISADFSGICTLLRLCVFSAGAWRVCMLWRDGVAANYQSGVAENWVFCARGGMFSRTTQHYTTQSTQYTQHNSEGLVHQTA